jgi:Dolichyl-phosphate-mannose-protein mannosyltransferase
MGRWFAQWGRLVSLPQWWVIAALFLLLAVPPSISPRTDINYVSDEKYFHIPNVRWIAERWPSLDLRYDALTPIAPGYHWFLAGVSKITGSDPRALRAVNLMISLAGLMTLFAWLLQRVEAVDAALLIAPLAASNIFVKSSSWVVTDNPALILAMIALLRVLDSARLGNAVSAGIYGMLATMTRQVHAWVAVPMLCRAILNARDRYDAKTLAWAAGSCSAVVVVLCLYLTWGGLVPMRWQTFYSGVSIVPLCYILSLLALFGVFYFPFEAKPLRRLTLPWALPLLFAILSAVAAPTIYDKAAGRWGGYLWELVRILPVPLDRSIVFVILAPIGMLFGIGFFRGIRATPSPERAVIWLAAMVGWSLVYLFDRQVFQRYYEPMILVFLIIAVGLADAAPSTASRRARLVGLAAVQTVITLGTVWWRTFFA